MPDVWTPGAPGPHDELIRNLLAQVERLGEGVAVSVELTDGSLFHLISLSPQPGFGFITLRPHPADAEPTEVVVPLNSIAQIRLGNAEPTQRLGFSLPVAEPPIA